MVTRKEREKEEEAERKAEEKAAKKAEIAAKRAARDAEKAAKLAEKAAGASDASSPSKAGVGEKDEDAWTADESEALVDGLRANPRGMHATEQARWETIAGGAGLEKRADALECVAHTQPAPQAESGQGGAETQEEAHAQHQEGTGGSCAREESRGGGATLRGAARGERRAFVRGGARFLHPLRPGC